VAERELNKERAASRARIKELNYIAEDTSKSTAARAKAAQEALAIESGLMNKQIRLQQEKVANIKAEQALTNNLEADNQALADAEMKLSELKESSLELQTTLNNKLNTLRKEGAAKALAGTVKEMQAEAELLELRSKNSLYSDEGAHALQIQALHKRKEIALKAENLTQSEIQAIKEKYRTEEETLQKDFEAKQLTARKEQEERAIRASYEASGKALGVLFTQQEQQLKQHRANGLLTEEEYTEQVERLKLTQLQGEVVALEQFKGKVEGIDELLAAKRLEISNRLTDDKIKNLQREEDAEEARMQRRQELLLADLEYSGEVMNMMSEQVGMVLADQGASMQQFANNILSLLIDTVARALEAQVAASVGAATVQAIASAESVATFGAAGVAKALALVALIRGASMAAKAAMQNAMSGGDSPKFAEGGYTGSGYGTPDNSGYKVAGVVHEGEYVAPKWMVNSNPALFGELERKRLRGYAAGGYVQPPATHAFLNGAAGMDYNKLAGAVAKEMGKVQIFTKVTDVNKAQSKQEAKAKIINQ
jgi:hypothetical protein